MGSGMHGNPNQLPAPHVNPNFFNQNSGPMPHHPHHQMNSGGMNQSQNMQSHGGPQHFSQMDQRSNSSWQGKNTNL